MSMVSYFTIAMAFKRMYLIPFYFICVAPVGSKRPLPGELKIGEPNLVIAPPGEPDVSISGSMDRFKYFDLFISCVGILVHILVVYNIIL